MKKLFPIATMLLLAACGQQADTSELATLIAERDSLKAEQRAINDELAELEETIAKLDTTRKLTKVTTVGIEPTKFEHYFEIYGNVETDENITIQPEVSGEIIAINVKEGQSVAAGDVLMQIDADVIRKNIEEVKTSLQLAQDIFERQQRLWNKKIGSEVDYLQAKNNKESLEKRLETLNTQLEMAVVTAPFSGIVDEIFPKKGEVVAPGSPLIRLVNLDQVYIKADISERYLATVGKGSRVKVSFPSLDLKMDTVITLTGNYVNPSNRTYSARIDIANSTKQIMPNLLAVLKVKDYEVNSAIVIPSNLVQQSADGGDFTYVVENRKGSSRVVRKVLKTGVSYEGNTLIESGLTGNEKIVFKGARSIKDGDLVEVVE